MSAFTSLNVRLPAITVGLALLSTTVMGGLSFKTSRDGLVEAASERLQFAASARKQGLEIVFERAVSDLGTVSANTQVSSNFSDLVEALDPAKSDFAQLVQIYTGSSKLEERLAVEATGTMYGRRHVKVQEMGRKLVERSGYADLIFVSEDGRIVYTTTKGADFSHSLAEPAFAGSGLAKLVERLKTSTDPEASL